jgi:hypothetical protein
LLVHKSAIRLPRVLLVASFSTEATSSMSGLSEGTLGGVSAGYELLEDRLTDLERKAAHGTKSVVDGRRGACTFDGFPADSMLLNARIFRFRSSTSTTICALLEGRRTQVRHVQTDF